MALVPVSAATTPAAARGRAPDWTRRRRASTAKAMSGDDDGGSPGGADHDDDLALHLVAEAPRELGERAAHDLLVHLRELAADRRRPVGSKGGQGCKRLRQAAGRLEGDDRLTAAQDALERARAARQEAFEAPAVGRQARTRRPRSPRLTARAAPRRRSSARCRRRSGDSRGPRSPGVPASEMSATFAPRSIAPTSWRARSDSFPSWFETRRGRLRPRRSNRSPVRLRVLAGDDVGLGQGDLHPLGDVVHVPDRGRADDQSPRGGHQLRSPTNPLPSSRRRSCLLRARARRGRCASGSSVAGRGARPLRGSGRRRISPAAMTPPPKTITSGSKTFARPLAKAPSRRPIDLEHLARHLVARDRGSRRRAAVHLFAGFQELAQRRLGMALGRRLGLPSERGARRDRLGAAVVGAVPLAARAVGVDDHVAELGPGAGRARGRPCRR